MHKFLTRDDILILKIFKFFRIMKQILEMAVIYTALNEG